jgi:hypothetical protein
MYSTKPATMKTAFITSTLIVMSFFGFNLNAQEDHYPGTYTGAEGQVGIALAKNTDGTYQGYLEVQGQRYNFSGAAKMLGMVNGNYNYQGNEVAFSVSRLLGIYYLTSEGISIELQKTANTANLKATQATNQVPVANTSSVSIQAPSVSGNKYNDVHAGYSFTVPSGWSRRESDGGHALSSPDQQKNIGIAPHFYRTLAEVKADVKDANDPSSNTFLKASTQTYGQNGLLIRFEGKAQGKDVIIETVTLVSPNGGGVSVVSAGLKAAYSAENSNLIKSIANSVSFSKPQSSPLADQWKQKVNGKRLEYFYTNNGMSDNWKFDLATDGSFVYSSNNSYISSGYGDTFSYAGRDSNAGRWSIVSKGNTPYLVLRYNNGSVKEYSMGAGNYNNEVMLNGKRYFIR